MIQAADARTTPRLPVAPGSLSGWNEFFRIDRLVLRSVCDNANTKAFGPVLGVRQAVYHYYN